MTAIPEPGGLVETREQRQAELLDVFPQALAHLALDVPGALDDTVIEKGVKIDNLVMIAHNCRIGG